jgi:kynurenine formamidase
MAQHREAGIDLSAADLLVELGVVAVGADTEALENLPSTTPGNPHPVHLRLLGDHGIYILELLALEELARDRAYGFLFICLPLAIRGATASMVSPVAIV